MNVTNNLSQLIEKSRWVWRETIKIHRNSPETRLASSLSPIDIFVALYYGDVIRFNPKAPLSELRDRCIISKGHGSICMYPILADLGFFSMSELDRVCETGGFLGGIPDPVIPGYETVNGSLGHGLGVSAGIALGLKVKKSDRHVFVVTGDGELHEGANWEAIMFASHHNLDNLHLIVDNNKICMLDHTVNIVSHGELAARLESFGWDCIEVNGHNVLEVHETLLSMKSQSNSKPKALIAHTKKGVGVQSIENVPLCHIMNPKRDELDALLVEN